MTTLVKDVDALLANRERPVDQLAGCRDEITRYAAEMRHLSRQPPDQAMVWLSAVSARLLEMRLITLQQEGRLATKFRIDYLIPATDECRYQFQIASRRQAVTQMDWEITRGYES